MSIQGLTSILVFLRRRILLRFPHVQTVLRPPVVDDDGNDDEHDGGGGGASICFHSIKGPGRNFCGVVNN